MRDNKTAVSGISKSAVRELIRVTSALRFHGNMFDGWYKRGALASAWRRDYGKMLPGEWFLCTINGLIERVTIVRVSPFGYYDCTDCDGNEYIFNCPGIDPNEVL